MMISDPVQKAAAQCVAFVCVCCLCVLQAGATTLLQDDFDAYPVGPLPIANWVDTYTDMNVPISRAQAAAAGVQIAIDGAAAVSGNSIRFMDQDNRVGSLIDRALASPATSVTLEYYMMSNVVDDEGAFVNLNGTGDYHHDYVLAFQSTGYIGVHRPVAGSWPEPALLQYAPGVWYRVERVINCATDEGYFYVEEVGNPGHNGTFGVGSELDVVESVGIWSSNTRRADCYIDELRVTGAPIPEPVTLASGLIGLGMLVGYVRRRRPPAAARPS